MIVMMMMVMGEYSSNSGCYTIYSLLSSISKKSVISPATITTTTAATTTDDVILLIMVRYVHTQ